MAATLLTFSQRTDESEKLTTFVLLPKLEKWLLERPAAALRVKIKQTFIIQLGTFNKLLPIKEKGWMHSKVVSIFASHQATPGTILGTPKKCY